METFIIDVLQNKRLVWWLMALVIFVASQLLKLPIKHATRNLPEHIRKRVNAVILLIPFGLGMLLVWLVNGVVMPKYLDLPAKFSLVEGVVLGSQSIAFYNVAERFLGKKIPNPYETEQGKKVLAQISDVVKDKRITKAEIKNVVVDNILTEDEQEKIKNAINLKSE